MSDFKQDIDIKLHHIGIAVSDIEDTISSLNKVLKISFDEPVNISEHKVKVSFSNDLNIKIELIEAIDEKSPIFPVLNHPIHTFIEKHGNGIHHICFETENLEGLLSRLKSDGYEIIGGDILTGSKNENIAFLKPNDCSGLLIELRECCKE